jgi:hypothetical protein
MKDDYELSFDDVYKRLTITAKTLLLCSTRPDWDFEFKGTLRACAAAEREAWDRFIAPIVADESLDPRTLMDLFGLNRPEQLAHYVYIATAWAVTAKRAHDSGEQRKSWACMCQAQYWLGRADETLMLPKAIDQRVGSRGRKGGSTRAENMGFAKVKEYALSLIEGKEHTFASRNRAATLNADPVFAFAKENNVPMVETNMINKLNDWYKGRKFGKDA